MLSRKYVSTSIVSWLFKINSALTGRWAAVLNVLRRPCRSSSDLDTSSHTRPVHGATGNDRSIRSIPTQIFGQRNEALFGTSPTCNDDAAQEDDAVANRAA